MGASVSSPDRRIVLLGKTGDGKSSAGNTILRKNIFTSGASPNSTTYTSVKGERTVYREKITVIDTPGLFDTDRDDETIKSEIIRSIMNCAEGIDALVIVLKVERYTTQEMEIVDKISQCFGEDTFKRAVVLFTHGEDLEGQTIEVFVQRSPNLQELVRKCGGRCHVIDSKYWRKCLHCPCSCGYRSNNFQVKNLLNTINKIMERNGRYTNELLQRMNEIIIEETLNANEDTVSPSQQRERAERAVHDSLLLQLAGASIGALTGTLLGVAGCVAITVPFLNVAAGTGFGAAALGSGIGIYTAGVTLALAGVSGFIAGVATGWEAERQADSVSDAINMSAFTTYENARLAFERGQEYAAMLLRTVNPAYIVLIGHLSHFDIDEH